jgi:hypothetical protein
LHSIIIVHIIPNITNHFPKQKQKFEIFGKQNRNELNNQNTSYNNNKKNREQKKRKKQSHKNYIY